MAANVSKLLDVLRLCIHAGATNEHSSLDQLYRLVQALAEAILEPARESKEVDRVATFQKDAVATFRYIPLGKNVLVRRAAPLTHFAEPAWPSGLPFEAVVVSVGVDVPPWAAAGSPAQVSPGDIVLVPAHVGISVGFEDGPAPGSELLLVFFDNLLAVVDHVPPIPTIDQCPRCTECPGQEHHWMENSEFADAGDPEYECKHCEAVCDAIDDADNPDDMSPSGIARPRSALPLERNDDEDRQNDHRQRPDGRRPAHGRDDRD